MHSCAKDGPPAAGGAGAGGGGGPANNKNAPPKCSSLGGALGVLAAGISEASQLTGTGYILGVQAAYSPHTELEAREAALYRS
jgi:hypothetical protein